MSFSSHPRIRRARTLRPRNAATGRPDRAENPRSTGFTTDGAQLRRAADSADLVAGREFDEKYRPMVVRWCRGLGLSQERAEERANDVLFEVLRRLPTFAYDPSKGFRCWLRTIVDRRVTDVRRRAREEPILLGDADCWITAPDEDALSDDRSAFEALWERGVQAHQRVQARVKPTSWALFRKVDIEDVPLSEAARELGLNYSNALKRLKQVRDALRREGERLKDGLADGTTEADEMRP